MISVLLPTVRPNKFRQSLDSIPAACGDVPYEVVIVADFAQPGDVDAVWIVRERRGTVDAINVAYAAALGSHVFLFNDEATLAPNALKLLYLQSLTTPEWLLSPRHVPAYTFQYFGKSFPPFPFAHRDVFTQLGGLLDPAFKSFYADPDLGMRAHTAGVPIGVVPEAVIWHSNGHDEVKVANLQQYMAIDQATFRARWEHLGEFRDC